MIPSGTSRLLEFNTTYSSAWSVVDNQGDPIDPVDIDDVLILIKKRASDNDDDAKITKNTVDCTITSGKVSTLLTPADTKDLQGTYYATLRIFFADGTVSDFENSDLPYITLTFKQGAVEAVSV